MKLRTITLFITLIIATLTACNNHKKADKQSETLVFEKVEVDTLIIYQKNANSPKCSISIHLDYAQGPNAHIINDSILKCGIFVDDELKRGEHKTVPKAVSIVIKNRAKSFVQICKESSDNNGLAEALSECYYNIKSSVSYGKDQIINYVVNADSYMGGTHGFTKSRAMNFLPSNGKLITTNDILKNNSEEKVADLIANKIAKRYGYNSVDDLRDNEGIFQIFDPYVPENFLMEKDSISFIYQNEEVGPYAVGEIVTKFSYDDLKEYINSNF